MAEDPNREMNINGEDGQQQDGQIMSGQEVEPQYQLTPEMEQLRSMGFSAQAIFWAFDQTNGSFEDAMELLISTPNLEEIMQQDEFNLPEGTENPSSSDQDGENINLSSVGENGPRIEESQSQSDEGGMNISSFGRGQHHQHNSNSVVSSSGGIINPGAVHHQQQRRSERTASLGLQSDAADTEDLHASYNQFTSDEQMEHMNEEQFVATRQRELEEMERQLENMERELEDLALKHNDMVQEVVGGTAAAGGTSATSAVAGGGTNTSDGCITSSSSLSRQQRSSGDIHGVSGAEVTTGRISMSAISSAVTPGSGAAAVAGANAGGSAVVPAGSSGRDFDWALPGAGGGSSSSQNGGSSSNLWTLDKTAGHIIALDLHRCLLYPVKMKPESLLTYHHGRNQPSCNACGSRKNIKWGCDVCNVVFCANCTRPYEFNPAPVEVANSEWKWYRTIITTRIVDGDHLTLCKLPTDFRVLVRPQVLRSKNKAGRQKMKSRWEIVSPIRGYVNPQKLAFDHFPFRYLHDQQYVKKPLSISEDELRLQPQVPEELVCEPCDAGAPKYVLVNPNSKNYNSALGSSRTQVISSLPLPVEISDLPYHRCYGSNLYACFLPKGFKVYHRQGPRGCAATHISGGCRRPWKRRDVEESQAALAYYCPLCEILLCAACAFDPKLCEKTDAAMKRDLDELTVGPPNIRLASLGRLRSSVETNWAEILTHIALDLGDKLGVCMLHKDERLVKESLSFAILVVAWLTEDEEKSARPWGKVRAGDIAIAPKIQEHILVPTSGSTTVLKPSRKKKITIADAVHYPGRPEHLIQADLERKAREEQSAKRVLWNDALVSRVIRSAANKETVCVVGSFRQMNGAYVRSTLDLTKMDHAKMRSTNVPLLEHRASASDDVTAQHQLQSLSNGNNNSSTNTSNNQVYPGSTSNSQLEHISGASPTGMNRKRMGGGSAPIGEDEEEDLRANFAGQWGSNCKRLKGAATTPQNKDSKTGMNMKERNKSLLNSKNIDYDFHQMFDKHCLRKKQVCSGEKSWMENLAFLDQIEYTNKDSKTRLVGYYLPTGMMKTTVAAGVVSGGVSSTDNLKNTTSTIMPASALAGTVVSTSTPSSSCNTTSRLTRFDSSRKQYVAGLGLGYDGEKVLKDNFDPFPLPADEEEVCDKRKLERVSLTTESESEQESLRERHQGPGGIPRNLLFWQLERLPRNVNFLSQIEETLSDANLEIGVRVRHHLYGKGTVLGWRYNDAANKSSSGGLRVGDTSGGLCSRGYARVLFDDIHKGKWNVPFIDCKVIGIAPMELACYPLQWYDNSIESLFNETTSSSSLGLRPLEASPLDDEEVDGGAAQMSQRAGAGVVDTTSMLIPLSAHDSSPSRSPSPSGRGRSAGNVLGLGPDASPRRSLSPAMRERRMRKRLMRRLQRVSSWGDFLKRPHHKAFALCRVKERFLWGVAFGCCTQEDANVLAIENCLSKKRPRETLVGEPWLVKLDSVLYTYQEDSDAEAPISPRNAQKKMNNKTPTGGQHLPGVEVVCDDVSKDMLASLREVGDGTGQAGDVDSSKKASEILESVAKQKSFEKLNSLSRAALRYRYLPSVSANVLVHWPCVSEDDIAFNKNRPIFENRNINSIKNYTAAASASTNIKATADHDQAGATNNLPLQSLQAASSVGVKSLLDFSTANRLQLRKYVQRQSWTYTLSPLRSLGHDLFDLWSDTLVRVVPLPEEQYDLTDPSLRNFDVRRGGSDSVLAIQTQRNKRYTIQTNKYTEGRKDGNILQGSSKAVVLVSWVDDDQENSTNSQLAPGANSESIDFFLNSLGVNGVNLLPQQDIIVTLDNIRKAFASDDGLAGQNKNADNNGSDRETDKANEGNVMTDLEKENLKVAGGGGEEEQHEQVGSPGVTTMQTPNVMNIVGSGAELSDDSNVNTNVNMATVEEIDYNTTTNEQAGADAAAASNGAGGAAGAPTTSSQEMNGEDHHGTSNAGSGQQQSEEDKQDAAQAAGNDESSNNFMPILGAGATTTVESTVDQAILDRLDGLSWMDDTPSETVEDPMFEMNQEQNSVNQMSEEITNNTVRKASNNSNPSRSNSKDSQKKQEQTNQEILASQSRTNSKEIMKSGGGSTSPPGAVLGATGASSTTTEIHKASAAGTGALLPKTPEQSEQRPLKGILKQTADNSSTTAPNHAAATGSSSATSNLPAEHPMDILRRSREHSAASDIEETNSSLFVHGASPGLSAGTLGHQVGSIANGTPGGPPQLGGAGTDTDQEVEKKLSQNYSETSLYSMLQQSNKSVFLPSQVAGLSGPGATCFPCLTYTDDSIPELDDIYPYDFDICKKHILRKWWPILVKKLIYYTNYSAACGNSQNTRASSNKKLCDDLLLLLIKYYPEVIRQDPENVGNPLFQWLSLTTTNSMCLRPHRFFQIVEQLVKQNFGKELARSGVKSLMRHKWDAPGVTLTKSITFEPEVVDLEPLKSSTSWDEAQRIVLEMAFGSPTNSSTTTSAMNNNKLKFDENQEPSSPTSVSSPRRNQTQMLSNSNLDGPPGVLFRDEESGEKKLYTIFELAQADVADKLLHLYQPEAKHLVEPRLVSLLQNMVTMTESLPLVVLAEKKRNPHGMQLITDPIHVQINKTHTFQLEPWVPMSEVAQRILVAKMQMLDKVTGEVVLVSSSGQQLQKNGTTPAPMLDMTASKGNASLSLQRGGGTTSLTNNSSSTSLRGGGIAGKSSNNSSSTGAAKPPSVEELLQEKNGKEFNRTYFANALDLVGSILVSVNLEYYDVLDFTVKTKVHHPVHLLCPSQRMRNMARSQSGAAAAGGGTSAQGGGGGSSNSGGARSGTYSPASMSPPMGPPGQAFVPSLQQNENNSASVQSSHSVSSPTFNLPPPVSGGHQLQQPAAPFANAVVPTVPVVSSESLLEAARGGVATTSAEGSLNATAVVNAQLVDDNVVADEKVFEVDAHDITPVAESDQLRSLFQGSGPGAAATGANNNGPRLSGTSSASSASNNATSMPPFHINPPRGGPSANGTAAAAPGAGPVMLPSGWATDPSLSSSGATSAPTGNIPLGVPYRQFVVSKNYGWQVATRLCNDHLRNQEILVTYASALNAKGHHIAINPNGVNIFPLTKEEKCLKLWFLIAHQQFSKGKLLEQVGLLLSLAKRNWVAERSFCLANPSNGGLSGCSAAPSTRGSGKTASTATPGGASVGNMMGLVSVSDSTPTPSEYSTKVTISGEQQGAKMNNAAASTTSSATSPKSSSRRRVLNPLALLRKAIASRQSNKPAPEGYTANSTTGSRNKQAAQTAPAEDVVHLLDPETTSAGADTSSVGAGSTTDAGGFSTTSGDLHGNKKLESLADQFNQCVKVMTVEGGQAGAPRSSSSTPTGNTNPTPSFLKTSNSTSMQLPEVGPNGATWIPANSNPAAMLKDPVQYLEPWTAEALFALGYRPNTVLNQVELEYAIEDIYELFTTTAGGGLVGPEITTNKLNSQLSNEHYETKVGEIVDGWQKVESTVISTVDFLQSVYEKLQFEKENNLAIGGAGRSEFDTPAVVGVRSPSTSPMNRHRGAAAQDIERAVIEESATSATTGSLQNSPTMNHGRLLREDQDPLGEVNSNSGTSGGLEDDTRGSPPMRLFESTDRVWSVVTEFPSGVPFSLIWEDVGEFVYGKCRSCLGKSIFSSDLFAEGLKRLEVTVANGGKGTVWGGLTRRMADNLATQLAEVIPCSVEPDPVAAKQWGVTKLSANPNMLKLRSLVQYSGGLGFIVDITAHREMNYSAFSGAGGPGSYSPMAPSNGGMNNRTMMSSSTSMQRGPGVLLDHGGHQLPTALVTDDAVGVISNSSNSNTIQEAPLPNTSTSIISAPSAGGVLVAAGGTTATTGTTTTTGGPLTHLPLHQDEFAMRLSRATGENSISSSSSRNSSKSKNMLMVGSVTYTICDLYTGEILNGFTRSQLDVAANKTKISPVHGITNAMELRRAMALQSGFASCDNPALVDLEAVIFASRDVQTGRLLPLDNSCTTSANNKALQQLVGSTSSQQANYKSTMIHRTSSAASNTSTTATTLVTLPSVGSSSIVAPADVASTTTIDGFLKNSSSVSATKDTTVTSTTDGTGTVNTSTLAPEQQDLVDKTTTLTHSSPQAGTTTTTQQNPVQVLYRPLKVPVAKAVLRVNDSTVIPGNFSLCQALWKSDSPYPVGPRKKMIYSHQPATGNDAARPLKLTAEIVYSVQQEVDDVLELAVEEQRNGVLVPRRSSTLFEEDAQPAWPQFNMADPAMSDVSTFLAEELGISSASCCHSIELLRKIEFDPTDDFNAESTLAVNHQDSSASGSASPTKRNNAATDGAKNAQELSITTNALDAKLKEQLSVPLLSVTRAGLPKWVFLLPQICPQLFSVELKKNLLISSCFPLSFRVFWLQQDRFENRFGIRLQEAERKLQEAEWANDLEGIQRSHDEIAQIEEESIRDREIYIGKMKKELVRVEREHDSLMPMARALFSDKLDPNASLEVIFKNESGFGPAVTQSFYSEVALALTDVKHGLFVPDDGASTKDEFTMGGRHGLILKPDLLFNANTGAPLTPAEEKEKRSLLRFLGRLIGRSLREGYRLPIPLSEAFFAMLQGSSSGENNIPTDWRKKRNLAFLPGPNNDGWSGRIVGALYSYAIDLENYACKVKELAALAAATNGGGANNNFSCGEPFGNENDSCHEPEMVGVTHVAGTLNQQKMLKKGFYNAPVRGAGEGAVVDPNSKMQLLQQTNNPPGTPNKGDRPLESSPAELSQNLMTLPNQKSSRFSTKNPPTAPATLDSSISKLRAEEIKQKQLPIVTPPPATAPGNNSYAINTAPEQQQNTNAVIKQAPGGTGVVAAAPVISSSPAPGAPAVVKPVLPVVAAANTTTATVNTRNTNLLQAAALNTSAADVPQPLDENDSNWSAKYIQDGGAHYSFKDGVDAGGLCFTAYGTHGPMLVENGENVDLTAANLQEFAEKIHLFWVHQSKNLYDEVCQGLWEGLGNLDPCPTTWLRFFTAKELRSMFCGDNEISWTEEELRKYVSFHGWDEAIELERRQLMDLQVQQFVSSSSAVAVEATPVKKERTNAASSSSALTVENLEKLDQATAGALVEDGDNANNTNNYNAVDQGKNGENKGTENKKSNSKTAAVKGNAASDGGDNKQALEPLTGSRRSNRNLEIDTDNEQLKNTSSLLPPEKDDGNNDEEQFSGFGSPRVPRSANRNNNNGNNLLSNLMNNDSEYNGNSRTGSEVDSDGEVMETFSPTAHMSFHPSTNNPRGFLPSPKNLAGLQDDQVDVEEDFKMRRWLIQCLMEMTQKERSIFIEFCTSCPRLPVGGLKALGLKILPEQPGRILPRSRACANTLFLPDYPTRQAFEYHLKLALHDSMGQFEQE
ncbi:unnamed protein product [Amoebophrya sp. A120]|nr:unnamed protein product [Amoebophrya sp. A120]|eukprot:GSA120T00001361001.1